MSEALVREVWLPADRRLVAFAPCLFDAGQFMAACEHAPGGIVYALAKARTEFSRMALEMLRWD